MRFNTVRPRSSCGSAAAPKPGCPSRTPEEAYGTTLYLNNRYFLDGRDANSFANVAWVFGQHDRGWTERDHDDLYRPTARRVAGKGGWAVTRTRQPTSSAAIARARATATPVSNCAS